MYGWKVKKKIISSPMSTEEALSLIISCSLLKIQYNLLRENAKQHNCDLYPSYDRVLAAKKNTYPEEITFEEEKCKVINLLYIF